MRFSAHFAVCLLTLILVPRLSHSQRVINWIGGIEFKSGQYGYGFAQQGAVLGEEFLTSQGLKSGFELAFSGGIQYQISKNFAMELGMSFREVDMTYHDAHFQDKYSFYPEIKSFNNGNGIYTYGGNMNVAEWYWAPYISAYYFFNTKNRTHPYLNVGALYNYFWKQSTSISGSYFYPSSGEELRSVVTYAPQYYSAFAELGLKFEGRTPNRLSWYFGLRTTFAGSMASADYYNINGDVINYKDHVSMTGTSWGLVMRISGLVENHSRYVKKFKTPKKEARLKNLLPFKKSRPSNKVMPDLKVNSREN